MQLSPEQQEELKKVVKNIKLMDMTTTKNGISQINFSDDSQICEAFFNYLYHRDEKFWTENQEILVKIYKKCRSNFATHKIRITQ